MIRPSAARFAPRVAIALATALAISACDADPLTPLPEHGPAAALEFTFGGFGGDFRAFELKGETLELRTIGWHGERLPRHDTLRVRPTAGQWRDFWSEARAIGVGRWQGEHVARHIVDGTGWHLRIVADGRTVEVCGSNMYPDRRGEWHAAEQTPEFRRLFAAVHGLAGLVVN